MVSIRLLPSGSCDRSIVRAGGEEAAAKRETLDHDVAMSLVANEDFQHILRVLNTNVDGKQKIMFALTSIKGIGRRFANIVCKKADVDMNKRAGELSASELENLMTVVANPRQFKIPDWFLNRKKDYKDGRYSQVVSNALDMKLRDDLERLKKIRLAFLVVFSGIIGDSVTTGAFEFVVSTQKLLGEEEKLLVSPRSDELNWNLCFCLCLL
ncbi:hypothetical protein ZIOFF_025372 [Zingiber officinale]|uniref:40S ribosomal protein S18 n=1 Tax=Zingiber officinale TaxID=94328 RepID=A0A8J5H3K9_ZINOF|nr:hypothetical protein ZIOFF_025372 [Zingiber officinale]